MRNKTIIGTILIIFLFSSTIIAQEKKQKVEVPQLTV